MPTINGIVETALYVTDLDRAAAFYRDVLGLRAIFEQPGRLRAFHAGGHQVLLLFSRGSATTPSQAPQGGTIPAHDAAGQIHVGFAVPADELPAWEARLREANVPVESRVPGPRGGTSLYVRDPDQNLVELLTPGVWPVY